MLPDGVSNPGHLTYESGVLPIALRGPAIKVIKTLVRVKVLFHCLAIRFIYLYFDQYLVSRSRRMRKKCYCCFLADCLKKSCFFSVYHVCLS